MLQRVVVKLFLGIFSFGNCCVDELAQKFHEALGKSIVLGVFWCDWVVFNTHFFCILGHFIT